MDNKPRLPRFLAAHLGLLLLAPLIGLLSGVAEPKGLGVRGAILSSGLALALVIGNWEWRRRLDAREVPRFSAVVGWALGLGFLSGLFAGMVPSDAPNLKNLGKPWVILCPAALGAAYGLACHAAYWCRWRVAGVRGRGWVVVWRLAFYGLACGAVRAILFLAAEGGNSELPGIEFIIVPLVALSGTLFCLLWAIPVFLSDPGLTFERWRSRCGAETPP